MFKTTAGQLPYRFEIFLGFGLMLLLISVRRTIRRWVGIRMVNQTAKFKWSGKISSSRRQRVIVYTIIESVIISIIGAAFIILTKEAWIPAAVMIFFGVEGVFYILVNVKNKFRVGLSSKAILAVDREVILLYVEGLRQVSVSQQTIYFDYIQDLQLSFPTDCIEESSRAEFFENLKQSVNREKVLFRIND
ncbi:MAG: hypothetical protein FJZ67_02190 [Bacteroidetes bacterium]|nr:hypothetical protein [Bacteroidota bacterium]